MSEEQIKFEKEINILEKNLKKKIYQYSQKK